MNLICRRIDIMSWFVLEMPFFFVSWLITIPTDSELVGRKSSQNMYVCKGSKTKPNLVCVRLNQEVDEMH